MLAEEISRRQIVRRLSLGVYDLHVYVTFAENELKLVLLFLVTENLLHQLNQLLRVYSFEDLVLEFAGLLPETGGYEHLTETVPVDPQTGNSHVFEHAAQALLVEAILFGMIFHRHFRRFELGQTTQQLLQT